MDAPLSKTSILVPESSKLKIVDAPNDVFFSFYFFEILTTFSKLTNLQTLPYLPEHRAHQQEINVEIVSARLVLEIYFDRKRASKIEVCCLREGLRRKAAHRILLKPDSRSLTFSIVFRLQQLLWSINPIRGGRIKFNQNLSKKAKISSLTPVINFY